MIIAAQCGVVGHTEIASGVKLIARSATSKSLTTPNGYFGGTPAQPLMKAVAELVAIKKLPEVLKKLKKAEKDYNKYVLDRKNALSRIGLEEELTNYLIKSFTEE